MRDSQDPNKTWEAYSNEPEGRAVPGPEAEGVERKVVLGENIPASAEQAKEELKYVSGRDREGWGTPGTFQALCRWCRQQSRPRRA